MIVVMEPHASDAAIEGVISFLVAAGFDVHRSSGQFRSILGVVGEVTGNDVSVVSEFEGVAQVTRVSEPFRLASRRFRQSSTVVDGPWGSVLAGRNIGLFGRGGINLDYDIEHGYGLGSPCMIINREPSQGPVGACGHVGFGILFPAFNAQITYATPELAGFQFSAGLFDPATVLESNYTRTPLPRVEGELSFKVPKVFHAEVSGSWQRIGHADTSLNLNVDSLGVAAAAGVNLGPLQLGVAGFTGQGLGIWVALENYPVFTDPAHVLRKQKGMLGMAALNFGHTKIAGGVGETLIGATGNDIFIGTATVNATPNFPNRQLGYSAGIYQGVLDDLVLGLDFFSANTRWNPAILANAQVSTPTQTVNFVNLGATLVF